MLTSIPSDSEILEAVKSINGGKAPGPDGFSATFYQSYWHIVGADVIKDVREFFTSNHLHPRQNETHIRLIPKVTGARSVAEYRPIALCNTHYKIIAKILTRRLKPLLPILISNTQSALWREGPSPTTCSSLMKLYTIYEPLRRRIDALWQ